jgi:hypothetical protein
VSLSAHDQQELDSIAGGIADSDPGLASMLATFARLAEGEELPAREQIRAAPHLRGWGRCLREAFRRAGGPAMSPGLLAVVLWLVVSVGLIASALAISHGDRGRGCATSAITCAAQAPAHALRPGGP